MKSSEETDQTSLGVPAVNVSIYIAQGARATARASAGLGLWLVPGLGSTPTSLSVQVVVG